MQTRSVIKTQSVMQVGASPLVQNCQMLNHLSTDLAHLLSRLHPIFWQESPWVLSPDAPDAIRHQITLEWLQNWCFVHSMGLPAKTHRAVANNQTQGLDRDFTRNLHQSNSGKGYWEAGWQVQTIDPDGAIVVVQDDLQLEINADRHLLPAQQGCRVGDWVNVRMPRNRIEEDYYVAIGNAGIPIGAMVELFFHLNVAGAMPFLGSLTRDLNMSEIPFRCALSYRPESYPRRDISVLQIARADYPIVRSWLADYYPQFQAHLQPEVPLFNQPIAPGIGLIEGAADPTQRYQRYRCLAEAILALYLTVDGAPLDIIASDIIPSDIIQPDMIQSDITPLIEHLAGNLTTAGFNLEHLYRNPGSDHDYPVLTGEGI